MLPVPAARATGGVAVIAAATAVAQSVGMRVLRIQFVMGQAWSGRARVPMRQACVPARGASPSTVLRRATGAHLAGGGRAFAAHVADVLDIIGP